MIRRAWNNAPLHGRSIFWRLLIALPAFILISQPWMASMPLLREKEDGVMDLLMSAFQSPTPASSAVPLAFIDIDEKTDRLWGEPVQLPRDKLLKLIEFATSARPRLVYVDVELSKSSCNEAADKALYQFISHYQAPDLPPLILPRGIVPPLEDEDKAVFRRSFLDDAYAEESTRAIRASALFDVDDNDGVLRRWRLFEQLENGSSGVLPSVQLLALSILRSDKASPQSILKSLQDALASGTNPDVFMGRDLVEDDALSQRIVYTIGTDVPAWRDIPTILRSDGVPVPYFERFSASCITDSARNPLCARAYPTGKIEKGQENWLKDRIVVIGASHTDSRDLFSTPLGVMPGAMVILNAISTLDHQGVLTRPPLFFGLIIETLIVILGYALHARLAPGASSFLFMAGVSVVLMPLCYIFFKYGMWVALAIPLFLSSISDGVEEIFERVKRHPRFSGTSH